MRGWSELHACVRTYVRTCLAHTWTSRPRFPSLDCESSKTLKFDGRNFTSYNPPGPGPLSTYKIFRPSPLLVPLALLCLRRQLSFCFFAAGELVDR